MDIKQIFGTILTIVGAIILIVAVMGLIGSGANFLGVALGMWQAVVVAILGLIFFLTGISLVKRTKSADPNS
jgi:hypothetical protein